MKIYLNTTAARIPYIYRPAQYTGRHNGAGLYKYAYIYKYMERERQGEKESEK
jgi:hypothetical protein